MKLPTFRPNDTDKKVMDKLTVIENHFLIRAQFDLFRSAVEDLVGWCAAGQWFDLENSRKKKEILDIVSDVSGRIRALGLVVIADSSTHEIVGKQVQILSKGLADLNSIQPGRCSRAHEEAAIMEVTVQFQKDIGIFQEPSQVDNFFVYDMVNPGADPIPIPSSYSKCRQVRRYLHYEELAYRPELWARYHDPTRQRHRPSGLMWEWIPQESDIQEKHLEFVSRQEGVSAGDYVVVLKYIQDQDPEELPEPLDLAPIGGPCCSSKCRDLQAHLKRIWPEHKVIHALKIQDGAEVLGENFDDNLFEPRTNSLYVHLERRTVIPLLGVSDAV